MAAKFQFWIIGNSLYYEVAEVGAVDEEGREINPEAEGATSSSSASGMVPPPASLAPHHATIESAEIVRHPSTLGTATGVGPSFASELEGFQCSIPVGGKVDDMRAALKALGAPIYGTKADLYARLKTVELHRARDARLRKVMEERATRIGLEGQPSQAVVLPTPVRPSEAEQ